MSSSLTVLSSEQYVARHEAEFTFNAFLILVALPSAELLLQRSAFAIFFCFVFPFSLSSFLFAFVLFGYVGGSPNSLLRSCMSGAGVPPFLGDSCSGPW